MLLVFHEILHALGTDGVFWHSETYYLEKHGLVSDSSSTLVEGVWFQNVRTVLGMGVSGGCSSRLSF